MIELNQATSGYGKARVLNDVSLSVAAGEVLAIVGANGAGKTTLAKTIAGSIPLWGGQLTIDGSDATSLSAERRAGLGVVLCPEGRRILSSLTVEENLRLGGTPLRARLGKSAAAGAVTDGLEAAYLRFPVLKDRRNLPGGTLSGGQQQMLAIARALMAQPRVLLLDEPSLGLAPRIVHDVYQTLGDLRDQGLGLLLIEEGAARALAFAGRGIVLQNGKVALSGAAGDLATDEHLARTYLGVRSAEESVLDG